jgi:hypothetical protein
MNPRHPDELTYRYSRPSLDEVGPSRFFRCDHCRGKACWIEPTPLAYALLCERCARAIANLEAHEKQQQCQP